MLHIEKITQLFREHRCPQDKFHAPIWHILLSIIATSRHMGSILNLRRNVLKLWAQNHLGAFFLGLKKTSQKPSQIGCWVNAECLSCPPLGMFQLHPTGSVRRGIAPLLLRWFRGFRPRCGLGGLRGVWMRGAAVPGVFRRILGHSQRISFARGVICGAYPSQPQVYGLLVLDPGCGQQCANRRLTTQQPSANHWLEPEI